MKMQIKLARPAGFCFGVKRALKLAERALEGQAVPQGSRSRAFGRPASNGVYSLGPIIHNPQVVERLYRRGLRPIRSLNKVKKGTLIISSHGAPQRVIAQAKRRGLRLIDTTCPYVMQARRKAAGLRQAGYEIIIFGEKSHPEVKALAQSLGSGVRVVGKRKEVRGLRLTGKKIGLVTQTTQSRLSYLKVAAEIFKKDFREVRIFDTICAATTQRQESARKVAEEVELVIVLGGKNSANTRRLTQICRLKTPTYHLESPKEIKRSWLRGKKKIGVVGGASTPRWLIEETLTAIKRIAK